MIQAEFDWDCAVVRPRGTNFVWSSIAEWIDLVLSQHAALLRREAGPVALADLYRAVARHPKARANRHFPDKVRQVLQQGAGRRVAPGLWEAAR